MQTVIDILQRISQVLSGTGFNILDLIIIAVFIFYAIEGIFVGFIGALLDFASFSLSFLIAIRLYQPFGRLVGTQFAIPQGFAAAIGFFLTAFICEMVLGILFRKVQAIISHKYFPHVQIVEEEHIGYLHLKNANHLFGALPGMLSAFVLLSFLLTLIIALPLSPALKNLVLSSKLGSLLVTNTQGFEKSLNDIFGQAISDTLTFMTVEPGATESVSLHFKTDQGKVDQAAENSMLALVNKERVAKGFSPLVMDGQLQKIARTHANDMVKRGYFSHYTPEGASPFDRMGDANIHYSFAGENLAFAPNTELAHQGLMQSPGHRANILSPNFGRVGIGVIDSGIYGEMFAQEFTD